MFSFSKFSWELLTLCKCYWFQPQKHKILMTFLFQICLSRVWFETCLCICRCRTNIVCKCIVPAPTKEGKSYLVLRRNEKSFTATIKNGSETNAINSKQLFLSMCGKQKVVQINCLPKMVNYYNSYSLFIRLKTLPVMFV